MQQVECEHNIPEGDQIQRTVAPIETCYTTI